MKKKQEPKKNSGYTTKIQHVQRPTNQSFYVNLPSPIAQALQINKGDEWEWIIEDKNVLILRRKIEEPPEKLRKLKN